MLVGYARVSALDSESGFAIGLGLHQGRRYPCGLETQLAGEIDPAAYRDGRESDRAGYLPQRLGPSRHRYAHAGRTSCPLDFRGFRRVRSCLDAGAHPTGFGCCSGSRTCRRSPTGTRASRYPPSEGHANGPADNGERSPQQLGVAQSTLYRHIPGGRGSLARQAA